MTSYVTSFQPRSQGFSSLPPLVVGTDLGCGWSRDHLSIQNRRVGGYSSTFETKTLLPHPSSRFFYHPDSGWSRDQPQPRSLFQRLREAEKRDPGNEADLVPDCYVTSSDCCVIILTHAQMSILHEVAKKSSILPFVFTQISYLLKS